MALHYGHYLYLSGGMNAAFEPAGLQEDQYAVGINVVSRSGSVTPRPDYQRMHLEFEFETDRYLFEHGRFQGSIPYSVGEVTSAVCVISGAIFLVNLVTGFTRELSRDSAYLDENCYRCYLCQVEGYIVIQDGTSLPVIIQGGESWVAPPAPEGPRVGTVMAYGHGRLFTKLGPRSISAGDINLPNDEAAVLKSFEHDNFAIGGAFAVGEDLGEIHAMTFANNYDSTTGDGPLLVGTEHGLVTFRVDTNRDTWLTIAFSKVQVRGTGITGETAVAGLNADTLFWSSEGLRSLAVLQTEVHDARRFVNVSRDVQPLYSNESPWFRPFISLGVANGRLLTTMGGRTVAAEARNGSYLEDVCFDGLFALDFDRIAVPTRRTGTSPTVAYDGIWTGLPVTGILETDSGVVLFGKRGLTNVMCKVGVETTGQDDFTPIRCRLFTRAFTTKAPPAYEDSPYQQKKFDAAFIWARQVTGMVPLKLWLSVDGSPAFCKVAEMVLDSPSVEWDGYGLPEIGESRGFARSSFPSPEFQCDPSTGLSLLAGYDFQFCIEWEGMLSFSRFLFHANPVPEETGIHCLDQATLLNLSQFSSSPEVRFLKYEYLTMYPGDVVFDSIDFHTTQDIDPGPGSTPDYVWPEGFPAFAAIWDETVVHGGTTYTPPAFPEGWPTGWPFTEAWFPDMPAGAPEAGEALTESPTKIVAQVLGAFAIMPSGGFYAWGENSYGSLGLGDDNLAQVNNSPQLVPEGGSWDEVACGEHFSIAIKDGRLFSTGRDVYGCLGLGSTGDRTSFTQIGILDTWTKVAVGNYSAFGIAGGKLYSWGFNSVGQLGQGTSGPGTDLDVPTRIGVYNDWDNVSSNLTHVLAMRVGFLYSWGNNSHGQLGLGTHGPGTNVDVPTNVPTSAPPTDMTTTWYNSFIIIAGSLYSCGEAYWGVLGHGAAPVDKDVFTWTGAPSDWTTVTGGGLHVFGTRAAADLLYSWGLGTNYRLGYEVTVDPEEREFSPRQVGVAVGWEEIQATYRGGVGRRGNNFFVWGTSYYGELGAGLATISTPHEVGTPVEMPWGWSLAANTPEDILYGSPFTLDLTAIDMTGAARTYTGGGAILAMLVGKDGVDLDAGHLANCDPTTGWVANAWSDEIIAFGQDLIDNEIDRITIQAATQSPLQVGVFSPSNLSYPVFWAFTVDTTGSINPAIVAPGLVDADVTWVRPDLTSFTGKNPASGLFTITGDYRVYVTDWEEVTQLIFAHDLISGDLSSWVLPQSMEFFHLYSTPTMIGDLSSWDLPPVLEELRISYDLVSGDLSSWVLPITLRVLHMRDTLVSGDVSLWVLPATLTYLTLRNTAVSYGVGGFLTDVTAALTYIDFTDCNWSTTEVNRALIDCVASGVSGGNLSIAGTNDPPRGDGTVARNTLLSRGWVVTI